MIESFVHDCLPYIPRTNGPCSTILAYPKWPCVCLKVNIYTIYYIMSFFQNLLLSSIMTHDCVTMWPWQHHVTVTDVWHWFMPNPSTSFQNNNRYKNKIKVRKKLKVNRVYYIQLWHSSLLVVLTSGYHNMTLFLNLATTFYLFNIFSIFYSSTLSTSISFISSMFYPSTSSLYFTTQLTFTIRWNPHESWQP